MNHLEIQAARRFGSLSPLRYPGGKASLAGVFADLIQKIGGEKTCYVEPYAGGAGAGIALLNEGLIEHLVINDYDPAVYAFWLSVLEDTDQFIERMLEVPISVEEWRRQREVYRAKDSSDSCSLGLAFFYLNRTNRSGILSGGVIGGLNQNGNYKMDARFNKEALAQKIRAIGDMRDKISLSDLDGRTVIKQHENNPDVFMYIDPPYVVAGSRLYLNSFEARDHEALASVVKQISSAQWLMTYDEAPLIKQLYAGGFQATYNLPYSANRKGQAKELLMASQLVGEELLRAHSAGANPKGK